MSTTTLLARALQIVLIDLLLAGDNALVIAMAVRALPKRERRIGIICGAGAAVVLRVGLTYLAARLLQIPYLQLAGGLFVLWIAIKVLRDIDDPPDSAPASQQLMKAIWYVVLADVTMSTDNILAIAGASSGSFELILFGLAVSIPFVVFSSNLLADLMNRYPATAYVGAAILGQVGGKLVMDDPAVIKMVHPTNSARYVVYAVLILAVLLLGKRTRPAPKP